VRLRVGISQERLAHDCGLAPNYISLLERGLRSPTIDTVWAVATRLAIRPSELIALVESDIDQPSVGEASP